MVTEIPPAAPARHAVQFYESDVFLLGAIDEFCGAALRAGDAAIVIATEPHRAALEQRWGADGMDIAALQASGRYLALDAVEALTGFMCGGEPDQERFTRLIGGHLTALAAGGRMVYAFGEMVAILAIGGQHEAALRLEALWNGLQQTLPFALLCAYPMHQLGGEALSALIEGVCNAHTEVTPAESYSALPTSDSQLRAIAVLQQKARSLDAEVAERRRSEQLLQTLLQISQKLHASLDLETLLGELVKEALRLVGATGGFVCLHAGEGMTTHGYVQGETIEPLERCWPAGEGLPGRQLVHPAAYLVNAAGEFDGIDATFRERFGARNAIDVPILGSDDDILGCIEVHGGYGSPAFTAAEREKLAALARIAAIAIENAHLYREAQAAVRLRDEFLAIASHELRTPLTVLAGQADLALRRLRRDGQLSQERLRHTLDVVTGQAARLAHLLDQLLDVASLRRRGSVPNRATVDLALLVRRAVAAMRPHGEALSIVLEAPETLPASIDAPGIEQVVTNLLDNAVRYSPDGGTIQVTLSHDAPHGRAILRVRDHGLGIPLERRAQVFERFFQAHAEEFRSGMGLGLYLSRQIVRQHGGTIRPDFPEDGGTCFTVELPLEPPAPSGADAGHLDTVTRRSGD